MPSFRFILLIVVCFSGLGCSGSQSEVQTFPVTGVVLHKNQPQSGVLVTFFAQDGQGVNAQALSDEEGAFTAATSLDLGRLEQLGMVPGNYKVTATKMEAPSFGDNARPPKNLLPEKYAKPHTTPFQTTVAAGEKTFVKLELK